MKSLLIFAISTLLGTAVASAATVRFEQVLLHPDGPDARPDEWTIDLENSLDDDIGGFGLFVARQPGLTFAFDPANALIDLPNSALVPDVFGDGLWDALIVNGYEFQPLVPSHSQVRIGTFSGASFLGVTFVPFEELYAPYVSLWAPSGLALEEQILGYSYVYEPYPRGPTLQFEVPEPTSLSLLGAFGTALYLGGNRRRRSASVGAPT